MIYFDNAASGFFKPSASIERAVYCMKELSVNPGRSGHRLSVTAEKMLFDTRAILSRHFNNGPISRVIFTANCTEALNIAIFGIRRDKKKIVSTVTEHNSVLRPLYELKRRGAQLSFAKPSAEPYVKAEDVLRLVDGDTAFVVMNAVSNVTGYKNEFEKVGAALKPHGIPLIVDGAQAAGHIKINLKADNVAALAVAGHKGLMATQGVGALIFTDNEVIYPLLLGGSGNETFAEVPSCYPEMLEAGTHNLPAITSLAEGVKFIENNMQSIAETLLGYTAALIEGLKKIRGVRVYSDKNPFGICSFSLADVSSTDIAAVYDEDYLIAVRGGFHCAPLMHKALNTDEHGLVRVSLSPYNTAAEINAFLSATEDISHRVFKGTL